MKTLSSYRFKNDKGIRVRYLSPTDQRRGGFPPCDTLALDFVTRDEVMTFGVRPDEAVILIRLLSDALFQSVGSYEVGLLKGYNGFGEDVMPLPKARKGAKKKARQKVVGKVLSKLKDEKKSMPRKQKIAIALKQAGLAKKGKRKK